MQQTETYKLKHIDKDEPFSPDTLNANTDAIAEQLARVDGEFARVDAAASAETARVNAALAAKAPQTETTRLNGEITRLETAAVKFDCGFYEGDGKKNRKIDLDFTPRLVYVGYDEPGYIKSSSGYYGGVAVTDSPVIHTSTYVAIEIVENGFLVSHQTVGGSTYTANSSGGAYRWFALG